jgi:geranylgeranyl pyrophosphate synthase
MLPDKRKLEQISPTAVVESNLEKLLGDDLALVRQTIRERVQTSYPMVDGVLIDAIPEHFPRAIITLGASRLGHSAQEKRVALASAIEMLHLAVSIHDFIPRGEVAITEQNRVLMGSAILIGDYCFGQASILAATTEKPEVVAAFADALAKLSERRVTTLIETPTQPHADSAILYASAAEVGALLVGLPRPLRYALREAAASFGEVLTDSETSVAEAILHLESLTKDRPAARQLTNWLRTHRPAS